jgi:hypothetical protein
VNLSLAGCSSAEPASVSVRCKPQSKKLYLQLVKKSSHVQDDELHSFIMQTKDSYSLLFNQLWLKKDGQQKSSDITINYPLKQQDKLQIISNNLSEASPKMNKSELITNWEQLVNEINNCTKCNLCNKRKHVVIERG